jgi:hypothetical protein
MRRPVPIDQQMFAWKIAITLPCWIHTPIPLTIPLKAHQKTPAHFACYARGIFNKK